MNKSTLNFCPVPQEQQPIHEYKQLKESWLFDWGMLAVDKYARKILWVNFWSFLIVIPLSLSIYTPAKNPIELILSTIVGVVLLTGLFLSRIYLGWQYVRNRLRNDRIFYEESGWYDGQTWLKPTSMRDRDRLVVAYEIEPIMKRLRQTYGLIAMILVSCSLMWLLKP
ncbi:MAG: CGLD27 family protein [Cyanobacteria bacterium J06621_8]